MVKVSLVSYTNSWPFLHGLRELENSGLISLSLDIPSACASKLAAGEVTMGLIPVAALDSISGAVPVADLGIAANGEVGSVFLFGHVPLHQMKQVILDYQSRTSARLLRVLMQNYWKHQPEFLPANPGFEDEIQGETGGLIIGDRAFDALNHFPFAYDLSSAWASYTGLPFVFAVWASTGNLDEGFLSLFKQALLRGLSQKELIIRERSVSEQHANHLRNYLNNNILYHIGPTERQGMELFLKLEKKLPL